MVCYCTIFQSSQAPLANRVSSWALSGVPSRQNAVPGGHLGELKSLPLKLHSEIFTYEIAYRNSDLRALPPVNPLSSLQGFDFQVAPSENSSVQGVKNLLFFIVRVFLTCLRFIPYIPMKCWVIFLKAYTSTAYVFASSGSFVTSGWYTPIIAFKSNVRGGFWAQYVVILCPHLLLSL